MKMYHYILELLRYNVQLLLSQITSVFDVLEAIVSRKKPVILYVWNSNMYCCCKKRNNKKFLPLLIAST